MREKTECANSDSKQEHYDNRDPSPTFRLLNLYLNLRVSRGNNPDFGFRNQPHVLGKTITLSGHSYDVAVLVAFAQRLSQREDVASEVGLLHKRVRPDGLHQFVFGDDLIRVAHQNNQELKGLGRKGNRLVAPKQRLPFQMNP